MFLIFLGGSLALGAGLLATASYSEGMLLAIRTAAECIGWLLLLATVVGVANLRRGAFGELGAATVTFAASVLVLYMAYFEWGTVPEAPMPPIRYAAAAEVLPDLEPGSVYKATLTSIQIVTPAPVPAPAPVRIKQVSAVPALPAVADACASKSGLAWMLCQEQARLEFCAAPQADAALCPSAIPAVTLDSPPG